MRWQNTEYTATIPLRRVGPVRIRSEMIDEEVLLPLATFEEPLWPSTHRGARVCTAAGGINAVVLKNCMTRSIVVEADSVVDLQTIYQQLPNQKNLLQACISERSRFTQLLDMHLEIVGSLLFIRFNFQTGDASGHNMATIAAEHLLNWILNQYSNLRYVSLSANYCSDKKVSAVNSILGRGKHVVTDILIPRAIVKRLLHTTPEKIVDLHIKKNLIGSVLAGGLRSANAHVANMLLGFYLATGQDAANIIEGSQSIVHAEMRSEDLYFSVTFPNLIIGSLGSGKTLPFVQENLALLGCLEKRAVGKNGELLAVIAAAAALCGELSLLAALTNPGELMRSHLKLERPNKISK